MFTSMLDHDVYNLPLLAEWARGPYARQAEFKEQLQACLRQPGLLPVEEFEQWTNLAMDDQDDLQRTLVKVWTTCYPDEALPLPVA